MKIYLAKSQMAKTDIVLTIKSYLTGQGHQILEATSPFDVTEDSKKLNEADYVIVIPPYLNGPAQSEKDEFECESESVLVGKGIMSQIENVKKPGKTYILWSYPYDVIDFYDTFFAPVVKVFPLTADNKEMIREDFGFEYLELGSWQHSYGIANIRLSDETTIHKWASVSNPCDEISLIDSYKVSLQDFGYRGTRDFTDVVLSQSNDRKKLLVTASTLGLLCR